MGIFESIALFGVMVTLAAIPSTSVVLVVTRAAILGVANGVAVSLGIVLGDLIFILIAVYGLAYIAQTMSSLFLFIKYIGALYLIWLGYTLFISKGSTDLNTEDRINKGSLVASLLSGFFLTMGDVKAIVFYMSLFPAFVDPIALTFADVLIIIFIMIVGVGGVKVIYAVLASKAASVMKKTRYDQVIKKIAGVLVIGAGCFLVLTA